MRCHVVTSMAILCHTTVINKYKTVEQWLCSWYQIACCCFFLIRVFGQNIDLRVKLTYVFNIVPCGIHRRSYMSADNQHFIWEQKEKSVWNFTTFTVHTHTNKANTNSTDIGTENNMFLSSYKVVVGDSKAERVSVPTHLRSRNVRLK